jgi:hypothetical protein
MLAPAAASSYAAADFKNDQITFQPHLLNFAKSASLQQSVCVFECSSVDGSIDQFSSKF